MIDGRHQTLSAVRYRLTAYRYPLSYWTVFPKAGGGARLRRRGDSPALPRGLRVVSPKGKRLTTFCASLALLHPLLSLTHWIFGSLSLSYKSSSHSAKCVRCASLRSGGESGQRRLNIFPNARGAAAVLPGGDEYKCCLWQRPLWWLTPPPCPLGSVSLDSQSPIGSLQIQFLCHPAKVGALWMLGSGVKVSLWQQRRENHTTGLRPEENRQTALSGA